VIEDCGKKRIYISLNRIECVRVY